MRLGMTQRMAELRGFIASYQDTHAGASPSYEEMMSGLGIRSKSTVHRLLTSMESRGQVVRDKYRARTVQVRKEEALEIACEHIMWEITNRRIGIRQVLERIFGRAPQYVTLASAIEQVAVAWERLQDEGRGQ